MRELLLVAGRAHGDRDLDRRLARPGCADLERLLADDEVVANLQLRAADRDDPGARDVAVGSSGSRGIDGSRPRARSGPG